MNAALIIICVLGFLAVLCLTLSLPGLVLGPVGGLLARREAKERAIHQELFLRDASPRQVMIATMVVAVVLACMVHLLLDNLGITVVLFVGTFFIPNMVYVVLREKRRNRLESLLPAALDQLTSYVRAGLSLERGLALLARDGPVPVNQEISLIVYEYEITRDLPAAIEATRNRLNSQGFDLAAAALLVYFEQGGNLTEALDRMTSALREVARMEEVVRTASTEGRKAMRVISMVPVAIALLVWALNPDLFKPLTGSFLGYVALAIAVGVYLTGLLWARRVLRIDV